MMWLQSKSCSLSDSNVQSHHAFLLRITTVVMLLSVFIFFHLQLTFVICCNSDYHKMLDSLVLRYVITVKLRYNR